MSTLKTTFTIGEFAKKARVTVRTLRFYQELGLLVPTKQNETGHRLYGLDELAKLQQIQALKFMGFSLQEIKGLLGENVDAATQLKKSLPTQWKVLHEKKKEIELAIKAVERIQFLLDQGRKPTWSIISSILFHMEHEQDLKEWTKEYMSDEAVKKIFSLPKETQKQLDLEMVDWHAKLQDALKNGVAPDEQEAFDLLIEMMEMATRHMTDIEAFASELEKFQESLEKEIPDFNFPSFLSPEEEAYLEEVGKAMEKLTIEDEK